MKTLIHTLFLCGAAWLLSQPVQAQELAPCGTVDQRSDWLRAYQVGERGEARNDELLYVPMQIHIVGTDDGAGYFPYKQLLEAFCTLNEDFAEVNIRFFFNSPINYIDNSAYYDHEFSDGRRMMNEYNIDDVINCYIVESPAGNCGYFSPGPDAIALSKSCMAPNDHTWAHEVGHFLSLPHTFFGWEYMDEEVDFNQPAPEFVDGWEIEKVDRSNCTEAGDGFCDTPADYLSYRWSCNGNNESTVTMTDPDGVVFRSDATLIMSYSSDFCASRFSEEQAGAMRANLLDQRAGHIATTPDLAEVIIPETAVVTPVFPTSEDVVTTQEVTIEWEPIPNATSYIVQLNPFRVFSIVFNEFIVTEPRVTFDALVADEVYYWRIKPVNDTDSCHPFTSPTSFATGAIVSSQEEQLPAQSVQLYPNPVNGDAFTLHIQLGKVARGYWQLHNTRGQLIRQENVQTDGFGQRQLISTSGLPSGVYWLRLVLDGKHLTQKIVIR